MKYFLRYVCAFCVCRLVYRLFRGRKYRDAVAARPCAHFPWGAVLSICAAPFVVLIIFGFVAGK